MSAEVLLGFPDHNDINPGFWPTKHTNGRGAGIVYTPNDGRYEAAEAERLRELLDDPQYRHLREQAIIKQAETILMIDPHYTKYFILVC